MILLNPGPVTLSERVRDALTAGDWCHREPEFAELTREINTELTGIYAGTMSRSKMNVLRTIDGCSKNIGCLCLLNRLARAFLYLQNASIRNGIIHYRQRVADR